MVGKTNCIWQLELCMGCISIDRGQINRMEEGGMKKKTKQNKTKQNKNTNKIKIGRREKCNGRKETTPKR